MGKYRQYIGGILIAGFLIFTASTVTAATCMLHDQGDANCDGAIDITDFEVFRKEYLGILTTQTADFDVDANITIADFEIWRRGYFSLLSTSPSPTTPQTSPTIVQSSGGVWISHTDLMKLPMSGPAWDAVKKVADVPLGTANMSDQDSPHPEQTYAVALVAARTGDQTYLTKVVAALMQAIGTEQNPDPNCALPTLGARGLAVGRNLIGYVVAADVIDFRPGGYDPGGKAGQFAQWVDSVRHRKNCDNNGGAYVSGDISEGHDGGCSNGNSLSGASRIAAAAYLGDKAEVDKAWLTFQRYAGNSTVGPVLSNNSYSQTWLYDANLHICINPKGATKNGTSIDGVLPNDQGRGGPFQMPPTYTQYPWEGLQGIYAQAIMLDHLGYKDSSGNDPWHVSDSALLRGVQYQWELQTKYGGSWYDGSRAAWVKHMADYKYGFKPVSYVTSGGGRNIDYTQWTHQ